MYYVGLDAHKQYTTIALLNSETRQMQVHKHVSNTAEAFAEVLAGLEGPFHGLVEAGRATWALYDRVHHLFDSLIVGDAKQLHDRRPSGGPTTDVRVARDLANMLTTENPPKALWVPTLDCRINRALTRGAKNLAEMTTKLINGLRSLCASFGLECPHSSLHLPGAKAWLAQVELPGEAQQMLELYLRLLAEFEAVRGQVDKIIEKKAAASPKVRRLMTMTGVGSFLGLGLMAELGDEKRFADGKAVVGYAGLAPQVHQSGNHTRLGPLPQAGNRNLRYLAVLAAQQVGNSRADSPLKRCYRRVAARHGFNPAKIAVARKLLVLAHHLLTHEEDYALPPPQAA